MFVRLLATLPGARSLELLQVSCALRFSTQTWSISNEIVYQSEGDHFYFLALFFFSFLPLKRRATLFCTIARNHCFRASQRGRSLAILCCTKCCSMHASKWSANSSEGKLLTNFPIISTSCLPFSHNSFRRWCHNHLHKDRWSSSTRDILVPPNCWGAYINRDVTLPVVEEGRHSLLP